MKKHTHPGSVSSSSLSFRGSDARAHGEGSRSHRTHRTGAPNDIFVAKKEYMRASIHFLNEYKRTSKKELVPLFMKLTRYEPRSDNPNAVRAKTPEWVSVRAEVHRISADSASVTISPTRDGLMTLPQCDKAQSKSLCAVAGTSVASTIVGQAGEDEDPIVLFFGQFPLPDTSDMDVGMFIEETQYCYPSSSGVSVHMETIGYRKKGDRRVPALFLDEVEMTMDALFETNCPPKWPYVLALIHLHGKKEIPKTHPLLQASKSCEDAYLDLIELIKGVQEKPMTLEDMDFVDETFRAPYRNVSLEAGELPEKPKDRRATGSSNSQTKLRPDPSRSSGRKGDSDADSTSCVIC